MNDKDALWHFWCDNLLRFALSSRFCWRYYSVAPTEARTKVSVPCGGEWMERMKDGEEKWCLKVEGKWKKGSEDRGITGEGVKEVGWAKSWDGDILRGVIYVEDRDKGKRRRKELVVKFWGHRQVKIRGEKSGNKGKKKERSAMKAGVSRRDWLRVTVVGDWVGKMEYWCMCVSIYPCESSTEKKKIFLAKGRTDLISDRWFTIFPRDLLDTIYIIICGTLYFYTSNVEVFCKENFRIFNSCMIFSFFP